MCLAPPKCLNQKRLRGNSLTEESLGQVDQTDLFMVTSTGWMVLASFSGMGWDVIRQDISLGSSEPHSGLSSYFMLCSQLVCTVAMSKLGEKCKHYSRRPWINQLWRWGLASQIKGSYCIACTNSAAFSMGLGLCFCLKTTVFLPQPCCLQWKAFQPVFLERSESLGGDPIRIRRPTSLPLIVVSFTFLILNVKISDLPT